MLVFVVHGMVSWALETLMGGLFCVRRNLFAGFLVGVNVRPLPSSLATS